MFNLKKYIDKQVRNYCTESLNDQKRQEVRFICDTVRREIAKLESGIRHELAGNVRACTGSEEFLDSIIERIKSKQLP